VRFGASPFGSIQQNSSVRAAHEVTHANAISPIESCIAYWGFKLEAFPLTPMTYGSNPRHRSAEATPSLAVFDSDAFERICWQGFHNAVLGSISVFVPLICYFSFILFLVRGAEGTNHEHPSRVPYFGWSRITASLSTPSRHPRFLFASPPRLGIANRLPCLVGSLRTRRPTPLACATSPPRIRVADVAFSACALT
jgi:hypothetical protein